MEGEPAAGLRASPGFLITSNNSWSMESRKIAPEKDVDGQQDDAIEVADMSPEWLLLDAGQLLLQCSLLC